MKGLVQSSVTLKAEFRDIQKVAKATVSELENVTKLVPFPLFMRATSVTEVRKFCGDILSSEERRTAVALAHLDFFGSQFTCRRVAKYQAWELCREIGARNVSIPYFGIDLSFDQVTKAYNRLLGHVIRLIFQPACSLYWQGA